MQTERVAEQLQHCGWAHLTPQGGISVNELIGRFGRLLNRSDIRVRTDSSQFIHSAGYVEFHTDDPRADYIIWQCHQPAEQGGENILKNLRHALEHLDDKQREQLEKVRFHVNLPGAPIEVPCLTYAEDGSPRFYYAPWKDGEGRDEAGNEALFFLTLALNRQLGDRVALAQGDILMVNNRFIVHGREPYVGGGRHLERFLVTA